jgi:spore maturation protein CgeB
LQEKRLQDSKHWILFGFGAGYHVEAALAAGRRVSVIEPDPQVLRAAMGARDLRSCLQSIEGITIGSEATDTILASDAELVIRPQTQTLFNQECTEVKSRFYGRRGIKTLHPKIGVLGPTQGGTLPITRYVTRALALLGQRVRELDMSGFAPGYHYMEQLVVDKMRLNGLQGTYIEMLSQVILESLSEKPVDILICMAQAPISGRVLAELRKRGVITVLWFVEDYLRFTYWKSMAQFYDFVFTIQKGDCIPAIRSAGAGEAHYLPVACDPGIHLPVEINSQDRQRWGSPVSFVGAGYHNRQQMFASLADFPFKIWGTEWPQCRPFDRLLQEAGRRLSPDEYIKIFNATDININLHSSTERDGVDPSGDFINPRTFELASAGAFQLVDERLLLNDFFVPGEDMATFHNTEDLKSKIAYYLEHPEERSRMAQNARKKALAHHTYQHRMEELLSVVYSSKFEHLKHRQQSSPWHRMLDRSKKHAELNQRCQTAHQRGEEPNLDGLVSDIVNGHGKLTTTEQKLLFLYHVRKQIIRMRSEEGNG